MNETDVSTEDRLPLCEQPSGKLFRAGCVQRHASGSQYFTQQRISEYVQGGVSSTMMARQYKGATDLVVESDRKYIVRRLTPTECARLQGFPDWWADGVDGSDSARYKMWGNGIALPCAYDVLRRIAENDQ